MGPPTYEALEQKLGEPSPKGYSMLQLDQAAQSYGAETLAVETTLDNLAWRPERFACLTLINDRHYVLIYKIEDNQVFVCDAPSLNELPRETFESVWNRKALLIGPQAFSSEEAVASRRAWFRRGRIALLTLLVVALGLIMVWIGRSVLRRRAVAVGWSVVLGLAVLTGGAGCDHESKQPKVAAESVSSAATSKPLFVEPEVYDLGRIAITEPNQTVQAQSTLRNMSDKPVTIETLVPSCACTDVDVEPLVIEPNGTAVLTTTIE